MGLTKQSFIKINFEDYEDYLKIENQTGWVETPDFAQGAKYKVIDTFGDLDATAIYFKSPAGGHLAKHNHPQTECVLVLEGKMEVVYKGVRFVVDVDENVVFGCKKDHEIFFPEDSLIYVSWFPKMEM
jgi:quercetin dioxygenase-like cupin family protein